MFEEPIVKYAQDLLNAVIRIAKSSEENGAVLRDIRTKLTVPGSPPPPPIILPPVTGTKMPGPPPNAIRVWSGDLNLMTPGPLSATKSIGGWVRADQPNAMTEIVNTGAENVMQASLSDIPTFGKSGSRGFFGGDSWNKFLALKGKMTWLMWETLILQDIPLQSEQFSGVATIGPEGKMGETADKKSLGIWGINAERINGQLRPWIQNSSNPQWVFKGSSTPLPIGVWYPNVLQQPWTFDLTGWQKYWYINGDNFIQSENVRITGVEGSLGAAFCFYVMDNNQAVPPTSRGKFSVQFRNMSLWVEA